MKNFSITFVLAGEHADNARDLAHPALDKMFAIRAMHSCDGNRQFLYVLGKALHCQLLAAGPVASAVFKYVNPRRAGNRQRRGASSAPLTN